MLQQVILGWLEQIYESCHIHVSKHLNQQQSHMVVVKETIENDLQYHKWDLHHNQ
jgi:hypothetical protein